MCYSTNLAPAGTAIDVQAAQTAVDFENTPLAPGFNAVVFISCKGAAGSPVVKIQGSDDGGTNWTDLYSTSGILTDLFIANVTVYPKMRTNVTTAGSAGDFAAWIVGAG